MSKNESATKGFAILSVAGVLNKILSVIYVPVLMQIVGDWGYSVYSAGYKIYQFIYVLTNSGFPIGISKLQAEFLAREDYRDSKKSFRLIKILMASYGLIMTLLTIVFARQFTAAINFKDSYLVILALAPTMFFSAVSCSYRGFFNGHADMSPTAVSQVIEQFLNVTLSLLFAILLKPKGIVWACAGATVGTTLGSLGSALYLKLIYRHGRDQYDKTTSRYTEELPGRVIIRRLLSYVIPIALNSVIVYGGDIVDLWNTESRLLASGLSKYNAEVQFGILSKYTTLLNVPLAITSAMYIAVMPFFSKSIALHDYEQLRRHIDSAYRTSLTISVPAAFGLAVLSRPVFLLLFSESYVSGWNLMVIGSVVVILVSIVQIQTGIMQAINKTALSTIAMVAGIFAKILINYFLISIPSVNIKGAVIGTIVCYIIAIYINSRNIRKYIPVTISFKRFLGRPVVASSLMAAAAWASHVLIDFLLGHILGVYLSNALATIISVLLGVAVYGLMMIRTGGITIKDLDTIPGGRRIKSILPKSVLKMAGTK